MDDLRKRDDELAEAGWDLSDSDKELVHMVAQASGKPLRDVASMLDAQRNGESALDYFSMSKEALNGVESLALTLYRQKKYDDAHSMFKAVVDLGALMGSTRASALRGMAACNHAQAYYVEAIFFYEMAMKADPLDIISTMAQADCLCFIGNTSAALQMARQVQKIADPRKHAGFIASAKNLIASGGGKPVANPTRVRPQATFGTRTPTDQGGGPKQHASPTKDGSADHQVRHALKEAQKISASAAMNLSDMPQEARDFFELPESKAMLEELVQMVESKRITVREVADFSDDQLEATYTLACQTLGQGDAMRAAQMAGWLSYIDSREPKYYRLAGLCMHNLKLWCAADYFYNICTIWQQGRQDPTTQLYQGEVKLMLGERDEGLAMLKAGVAAAQGKNEFSKLVKRGQTLLSQLANSQASDHKTTRP